MLPTFALLGWVVWRSQPSYQRQQLDRFVAPLGLRAEFDRRETASPGSMVFHNVRLCEAETGEVLAWVDQFRTAETTAGVEVRCGVLDIDSDKLPQLAGTLRDSLRRLNAPPTELRFESVRVAGVGEWADVRLTSLDTSGNASIGRTLKATEQRQGGLTVELVRNRQTSPPTTQFSLLTGASGLTWSGVGGLPPLPSNLGAGCQFHGKLLLHLESQHGNMHGELSGVDLAKLTPPEAALNTDQPASLSSVALAWRGERLSSFDASVRAGKGSVGLSFAHLAAYYLQSPPVGLFHDQLLNATNTSNRTDPLFFDNLAFRIRADGAGIRITGLPENCQGQLAPWLLVRNSQPLLFEPRTDRTPIEALLQLVRTPGVQSLYHCPRAIELSKRLPIAEESTTIR